MDTHKPDHDTTTSIWHRFFVPVERATWVALLVGLAFAIWLPLSRSERIIALVFFALTAVLSLLLYRRLLPSRSVSRLSSLLASTVSIALVSGFAYIFQPYGLWLDGFYVIIVSVTGTIAGWRMAVLAALMATVCGALVGFYGHVPEQYSAAALSVRLLIYILAGYLSSSLCSLIQLQAHQAARQSQRLAFLLDISTTTQSSLSAKDTLPRLAERIATALPSAYCCLCTLDDSKQALIIQGAYTSRLLAGWPPIVGAVWPLRDLPRCHESLGTGRAMRLSLTSATMWSESERRLLFPSDVKTAYVLPIVAGGANHGLLIVGEARSRQDEHEDDTLSLLQTVTSQLGVMMQNLSLHQATLRQGERFAVLVEIGRAVGSTLNLDKVLEIIYEQLQRTILSDSYFVALYDPKEGVFDLRILIDEGQRYPPQKIPLGDGLATWVVLKRQPLLVRHLSAELDSLPMRPRIIGSERLSESWLGVPIIIGEELLGLLAVASYQPNAFNDDDVALLSSVAQQAALALDNARQHTIIREQAQRDSLTGVYNHGHLLLRLKEAVESCTRSNKPVSLIMLDIDRFKQYNDRYGHIVGDEVLRLIAQTIQAHVRQNDIVGRWGGEEFAVVLPETASHEAREVAQRIQQALANISLVDSTQQPIPTPTISQGIATLPEHVADADTLIVLADRMLYRAKDAGRNTIKVVGEA